MEYPPLLPDHPVQRGRYFNPDNSLPNYYRKYLWISGSPGTRGRGFFKGRIFHGNQLMSLEQLSSCLKPTLRLLSGNRFSNMI